MPENERNPISTRSAIVGAVVFIASGFATGYAVGIRDFPANTSMVPVQQPAGVDFSPVWKAWKIIDEKFVPAAVATSTPLATSTAKANEDKVWGMVAGLAASLNDPYTYFLPPSDAKLFTDDMSGSFEGVGMEIAMRDQVLTVVSPLKGSPAEKAGIKSGDKILKIDDADTKGMDVSAAVKKIRGTEGSQVVLSIFREGWPAPKDIKVTRSVISVPAIETKRLSNGVFVISVMSFTANSADLFRSSLREFIQSGDSRLILDLRGNPGGYLESAVDMASWFLPVGKVIVTEDYAGNAQNVIHRSRGYDIFTDKLKMVVLVNRGSASASEILADALRHYGKAKLVGEPTFGKGSVQELIDITPETALKLTIARWLGPDGKQMPHSGIVPDIEIKMTEEDEKAEKDPQMDKAVEMLLGQ